MDGRVYEVVLGCNLLSDMRWYEVEDKSLEVKEKDDSELLLDNESDSRGCWWLMVVDGC